MGSRRGPPRREKWEGLRGRMEVQSPDKRKLSPDKREALRQVIIELFADALFHDVGLREICARAGVTPRTVYKHFGNKNDLLLAAITPDLDRLSALIQDAASGQAPPATRIKAALNVYTKFYLENEPVARIVFLNIPSAYFVASPAFVQERQLAAIKDLIAEARAAGMARDDAPLDDQVDACAAVAMRAMHRALTIEAGAADPAAVADRIWRLVRPMILFED